MRFKQDNQGGREVHCSMDLDWVLGSETPLKKLCGGIKDERSSGPCTGMELSCEFPEANFRLELSIHQDSGLSWHTKRIYLYFLPQSLPRGIMISSMAAN